MSQEFARMVNRKIVVGTAGHIDHGKTELIKALTGIDTDRLREEKERGISIELGFAFLDAGNDNLVSIIDVPGHERFIKHMVAGATGIDFVIMVVAADEGVMPQTREHLMICELLGIKKGVVVITKKDLVDAELLDMNIELTKEYFNDTFLGSAPVFAVSARTGEGIPELKSFLTETIMATRLSHDSLGMFHLYIDRVFSMKGFGTVVTGTALGESIEEKTEIMIYPAGYVSRARNIQVHGKPVQVAHPGQRTAINLQNIATHQIERGNVLGLPEYLKPSYLVNAKFFYLKGNKRALKTRARIRLHHGTSEIMGRIVILDKPELSPGESAYVQIRLETPVVPIAEDRFIIRSYSPMHTIGGGFIIDPAPGRKKRKYEDIRSELQVLEKRTPLDLMKWLLSKPTGQGFTEKDLARLSRLYRIDWQTCLQQLLAQNEVLKLTVKGSDHYILQSQYHEIETAVRNHLDEFHKKNPLRFGLPFSGFHSILSGKLEKDFLRVSIEKMVDEGKLEWEKDLLKIKGKQLELTQTQKEIWEKLETLFMNSGVTPPNLSTIVENLGYDPGELSSVLNTMVKAGRIVELANNTYFHNEHIKNILRDICAILDDKHKIGVAEIKNHFGITRKYAIPILEYTDQVRLTRREGDSRVPGELFTSFKNKVDSG